MKLEAMLKVTLFACITVSYVCPQDAGGFVSHGILEEKVEMGSRVCLSKFLYQIT